MDFAEGLIIRHATSLILELFQRGALGGEPEDPHQRMEIVGFLLIERIEPVKSPTRLALSETGN
jgi:hypothetical protein